MQIKEVELNLKKFNISRDKKASVGKRIGDNIWIHKDYVLHVFDLEIYTRMLDNLPESFRFDVVRITEKTGEVTFISSPDFNTSNEPIVSDSIKLIFRENEIIVNKVCKEQKNPLIYHHKWLFVLDDFIGFSVDESKKRSLEWKKIMGINKELSVKIGRSNFWDSWLKKNKLKNRNVSGN